MEPQNAVSLSAILVRKDLLRKDFASKDLKNLFFGSGTVAFVAFAVDEVAMYLSYSN